MTTDFYTEEARDFNASVESCGQKGHDMMTSKISWFSFVPLTIGTVFFKMMSVMAGESAGLFGLTSLQMDYISLGCVVLIFIFSLIFSLADRKISPYYIPSRNIAAGIFLLLFALLIAADGSSRIMTVFTQTETDILSSIDIVLSIISAVVLVVLGLSHFMKKNDQSKLSLLYLIPAVMFAIRLVKSFVSITTVSIRFADISELSMYVFLTLFWFNYAVMLSLTEAKNAVKSLFIYGFPAIAAAICYGCTKLVFGFSLAQPLQSLPAAEAVLIALYLFCILAEITARVKTRDLVEIKGLKKNQKEEEEQEQLNTPVTDNIEGFVVTSNIENPDELNPSSYYANTDTKDYLYRDTQDVDRSKRRLSKDENEGYLMDKSEDLYAQEEQRTGVPAYMSRMDEIDKLILEISEEDAKH